LTAIPTEEAPEPLQSANYLYDGDGNLVKSVVNSTLGHTTTTYFPGKHYSVEEKGGALKVQKHYAAGSTIIAVRTVTAEADTLQWMISDQLGSTSTTANADGTWNSDIRYTAFGEIRLKSGVTASGYRYTGQLDMQGSIGLDYYVARFYDPQLARFAQADNIIPDPGKSVSFDRYAYVHNNPILYNDPTGHDKDCGIGDPGCKRNVAKEKAETLLTKLATSNSKRNWSQLSNKEERTLVDVGWDEWTFNHSDFVIPSITNIGGTFEDPAIYTSLIISTSIIFGPGIVGGGKIIFSGAKKLALQICMNSPKCVEIATLYLAKQLEYSNTVETHMQNSARWVPPTTIADTILFGQKIADPQGVSGFMKYTQELIVHSKDIPYTLEVVYSEVENLVVHVLYK
jgi:RHS repeat-associated protein